ncbi:hypothetical protein DPMN_115330 [Dreissena polymorpha]|uniref:DUF19 domain-containing protein n=1 Tax=Dreissena polymorpha TaxID=45954 RepID=A0A9D4KLU9_DREPO|nr:hypothetical protein DPMN_115330 [Dreissena polymorpha]
MEYWVLMLIPIGGNLGSFFPGYNAGPNCSDGMINTRQQLCMEQFELGSDVFIGGIPVEINAFKIDWLCTNINNLTTCLETAMGTCRSRSHYYDVDIYVNVFQRVCDVNKTVLLESQKFCEYWEVFTFCLNDYQKNLKFKDTVLSEEKLCQVFETFKACIQINVTSLCTTSHSEVMTEILRARVTLPGCSEYRKWSPRPPASSTGSSIGFECLLKHRLGIVYAHVAFLVVIYRLAHNIN